MRACYMIPLGLSYLTQNITLYEGENILVDHNQVNPQNLIDKFVVARNSVMGLC